MERVDYESIVIQDLLNWNKAGEIDVAPWYQRRSVWTPAQKGYLINTIYAGKPVPTIYIRHKLDLEREKSIKEVVDGQQRIRSIIGFREDDFAFRHPNTTKRVKFSDLSAKDRTTFLMTKISVGYLIGASDPDVIDIFGRINSVSKTLNDQEKRNANFSGEFKQFCLGEAAKRINVWRNYQLFTANEIARMQEVKFISELTFNMLKGLSDTSTKALDKMYEDYDDKFTQWTAIEKRFDAVFEKLAGITAVQIKDTVFKRQPLFFSLFLLLDKKKKVSAKKITDAVVEITDRFPKAEGIDWRAPRFIATLAIAIGTLPPHSPPIQDPLAMDTPAHETAALLVIDVQRGFDDAKWGPRNNPNAENVIAELIGHWRANGRPVIHVAHDSTEPASPLRPGQPGNQFKPEAVPAPGEAIYRKTVNSAFIGTALEADLGNPVTGVPVT